MRHSNSRVPPEKPLLPSKGCVDLREAPEFVFREPPQSAPPEISSMLYEWPSPKAPPPGAQLYQWSNGIARNTSSSSHQAAETEDATRRNERFPSSGTQMFQSLKSPDGTTAKDEMWMKKPPFHLPPLDPSVFEKKGKSPNLKGTCKKKKKRQENNQSAVASSADPCQETLENNDNSATKIIDNSSSETGQQYKTEEELGFGNQKLPPANKQTTKIAPRSPRKCYELPTADHFRDHRNGNFDTSQNTQTNVQLTAHGGIEFRVVCPSQKIATQPSCSSRSSDRHGIPIRVQAATVCRRTPTTDHCSRRNANAFDLFGRIPTSPGNRDPVGLEGQVSKLAVVRRRSSQPDLRQFRMRRMGVCRETEHRAFINDRMKARVLMKKFGELNISGEEMDE